MVNIAASLLILLMSVVMLGTLVSSSIILSKFLNLDLKDGEDSSKSYKIVMWSLIACITLCSIMLIVIVTVVVLRFRKPAESMNVLEMTNMKGKGLKETLMSSAPLMGTIIMSTIITALTSMMYFAFRNIEVNSKDSSYNDVSNFVFISPVVYIVFTFSVILIWTFRSQLNSCAKKLDECSTQCKTRTSSVENKYKDSQQQLEDRLSEERLKRQSHEQSLRDLKTRQQAVDDFKRQQKEAQEVESYQQGLAKLAQQHPLAASKTSSYAGSDAPLMMRRFAEE